LFLYLNDNENAMEFQEKKAITSYFFNKSTVMVYLSISRIKLNEHIN
jgi:hypothetical protein